MYENSFPKCLGGLFRSRVIQRERATAVVDISSRNLSGQPTSYHLTDAVSSELDKRSMLKVVEYYLGEFFCFCLAVINNWSKFL